MPPLRFVPGYMLRGRAAGLARELGKASLMHMMRTRRVEADRAHVGEAFDQSEHRRRLGRFRHLAQPRQPALRGFRPPLRQAVEPLPLLG